MIVRRARDRRRHRRGLGVGGRGDGGSRRLGESRWFLRSSRPRAPYRRVVEAPRGDGGPRLGNGIDPCTIGELWRGDDHDCLRGRGGLRTPPAPHRPMTGQRARRTQCNSQGRDQPLHEREALQVTDRSPSSISSAHFHQAGHACRPRRPSRERGQLRRCAASRGPSRGGRSGTGRQRADAARNRERPGSRRRRGSGKGVHVTDRRYGACRSARDRSAPNAAWRTQSNRIHGHACNSRRRD